jgi:hypothetical protein
MLIRRRKTNKKMALARGTIIIHQSMRSINQLILLESKDPSTF